MILEKIISFDTAKLAKEVGVPQTIYQKSYWVDSNGNEINAQNVNGRIQEFKASKYITAYTQSALKKWIRDEYQIHITVADLGLHTWSTLIDKLMDRGTKCVGGKLGSKNFDTYEEALENGLYESLTLINEKSDE